MGWLSKGGWVINWLLKQGGKRHGGGWVGVDEFGWGFGGMTDLDDEAGDGDHGEAAVVELLGVGFITG